MVISVNLLSIPDCKFFANPLTNAYVSWVFSLILFPAITFALPFALFEPILDIYCFIFSFYSNLITIYLKKPATYDFAISNGLDLSPNISAFLKIRKD